MSTANSPPPQLPNEYLPALDDCIRLALSLLRSDKGSAALSAVGRSTAQKRGLGLSETMMEVHVKRFIEELTNDGCPTASFIPIRLAENVDAYDAAFIPSPDAGHWPEGGFSGFGTMAINGINIRAMSPAVVAIKQEKPDVYRRFLFNTGLALARELVHCFLYTIGARGTSPVLGTDDIPSVWERKTFGGLLVSDNDHKQGRPGTARLCLHCWIDNDGKMQQIKLPANLEKCIPKKFPLPLQTINDAVGPSPGPAGGHATAARTSAGTVTPRSNTLAVPSVANLAITNQTGKTRAPAASPQAARANAANPQGNKANTADPQVNKANAASQQVTRANAANQQVAKAKPTKGQAGTVKGAQRGGD